MSLSIAQQRVSTSEIKDHIAFLRAVHVASSRGKGSLLYADGPPLRAAVRAYFAWLSKAAEPGPWSRAGEMAGQALVTRASPLGIAWCWHVHRLTPLAYARHCAALTGGTVVYPAPGYGFAWVLPKLGFDVTNDVANDVTNDLPAHPPKQLCCMSTVLHDNFLHRLMSTGSH